MCDSLYMARSVSKGYLEINGAEGTCGTFLAKDVGNLFFFRRVLVLLMLEKDLVDFIDFADLDFVLEEEEEEDSCTSVSGDEFVDFLDEKKAAKPAFLFVLGELVLEDVDFFRSFNSPVNQDFLLLLWSEESIMDLFTITGISIGIDESF